MNQISYDLFYLFYVVAKSKTITEASQELYISQPAVSYSIKKLESLLGGKLFIRNKRGVELTSDGLIIYNQLKDSIEKLNDLTSYFEKLKSLQIGKLRIGSDTSNITIFLTSYIQTFHQMYPEIDIEIIHMENVKLIDKLMNNELDILVLNLPCSNKNIKIIKKKKLKDVIIANKELYNEYKDNIITMKNIQNYPFVLLPDSYTSRKNIDDYFSKYNITINPKYEFDSYSLMMDFVKKGFGLGITNKEYIENELALKELFILKADFEIDIREIGIAIRKDEHNSFVCKKFIDILNEKNESIPN